jgi:peptide/nickel transport system substrate-binding protein
VSFYRPRWPLIIVLAAGVAAVIGIAYLPSDDTDATPAERGGVYIEGITGAPAKVNPLFAAFNDVDADLSALVFSGLVRLGPNGAVQPDLADRPQITPDGRTYIFQLRDGLFWHDGEPLDSADVAFTVRAIQDPDFEGDPVLADLFEDVEVETPDGRTVIFTLPEAFAPFLARGATVGILPEHLLGELTGGELAEAPFNGRPVGSGPFQLTRLTSTEAALTPFASYHFGRPLLERLELRFFSDSAALMAAVRGRAVDGAFFRSLLRPDDIDFIDGDDRWVRRSLHGTTYSLVYLNPQVPAFAQSSVRRALQHGIDRQEVIVAGLAGQALPMDSPLVPDLWAYDGQPDAFAFDPPRADAFLDTFGWGLNEDGLRERDGERFHFTLAVSDDAAQVAVAQELQRQWADLGIEVEVEVSDASQFVERVLLPRQFEAALVTVDPGPDPDPYPLWHSTQTFGDGRNLAGFSHEEADRLLENGRQTASAAERAEAYRAFQEIYAREIPAILLYTPTFQYVVRAGVQGLSPGLLLGSGSRFQGVHLWHAGPAGG